jgi:hypothetical protein
MHWEIISTTNLDTNNSDEAHFIDFIVMQPMHVSDILILVMRVIVLQFALHLN